MFIVEYTNLSHATLGIVLWIIVKKYYLFAILNYLVVGILFGLITWGLIININVGLEKINNPLSQSLGTTFSSLVAFWFYGIIVSSTINRLNK